MFRVAWLALPVLTACVTPAGQRVSVLLLNETVICNGPAFPGPRSEGPDYTNAYPTSGVVVLDQTDDLYMLEFTATNADQGHTRPTIRNGLEVVVPCLAGEETLTVRRASILHSRRDGPSSGGSSPAPGGGGNAAAPSR